MFFEQQNKENSISFDGRIENVKANFNNDKRSSSMFNIRRSTSSFVLSEKQSDTLIVIDDDNDTDSDIEIDGAIADFNQHDKEDLGLLKRFIPKLDIETELIHITPNQSLRICTAALFYSNLPETHIIVINHTLNSSPECAPKRHLYINNTNPILSIPSRARIYSRCSSLLGFIYEKPCSMKNANRYLVLYDNFTASYQLSTTFHLCLCQDFDKHLLNIDYSDLQTYYRNAFRYRHLSKQLNFSIGMIIRVKKFDGQYHNARIIEKDYSLIKICFYERKSQTQIWIHCNASIIDDSQELSLSKKLRISSSLSSSQSQHSITDLIISNTDLSRLRKRKTNVNHIDEGKKKLRDRLNTKQLSIPQRQSSSSSDETHSASRANMLTAYYTDILLPKFRLLNNIPYVPHKCDSQCVLVAEESFHPNQLHINPFLLPFKCQWSIVDGKPRGYRTPCHRTLYSLDDIEKYLFRTDSKLSIKFFIDDLLTRFVPALDKFDKKFLVKVDLANGQENILIPVYNDLNNDKPDNFTYITQILPFDTKIYAAYNNTNMTSCCTCIDNCSDRMKCACYRKTLNQALLNHDPFVMEKQRNRFSLSNTVKSMAYQKKRLLHPVSSGIYECNSKCSCHKEHCSNRLIQQGLFVQLQLFQDKHKGWGLRTLHDLPRGTYICQYIGELITSDQGHERAQTIDDRYQTSLDLVRQIRYENNNNKDEEEEEEEEEPYVIDGSLYSNLGKYFNHSCDPNMYIQNVFIESHDLHFPHLALFTRTRVKAGEELTWHYNCELLPDREVKCFCGSKNCRGRLF
ncbi:hypothetical protein I4U23_028818 [Adineta vaga]|nr:hypothetical protein I4U23_028818 [Adineta vaga]